jgi:hypothetical protein
MRKLFLPASLPHCEASFAPLGFGEYLFVMPAKAGIQRALWTSAFAG